MKIAAIDIGSNAVRLLIVEVIAYNKKEIQFNQINFLRLPLRLGGDVFQTGEISQQKAEKMVHAMHVFQSLLTFYDVKYLKACATSAMRNAKNSKKIIESVKRQTGIKIKVITGEEEAFLVHHHHIKENMDRERGFLYANVGGGSTDILFVVNGKIKYRNSFDIGTIRLVNNLVKQSDWNKMKTEIQANITSHLPVVAVGTGGNINKIFSLSKKKEGKPLSLDLLKKYYEIFNTFSAKELIHLYGLREDRADVIVPAMQIYINMMRWGNIKEIYVPRIDLVDGLVRTLYQDVRLSPK
jgi:exopolyphosphatase / guanosine-5'-triphosphate,3'-diphosphate pyrophosphatase